ncbi:hypothetical protein DFJ73DRAFT_842052 [Zopfochytrium polystomum]|nr:hypothetical protein DFJ73DRAFT_842052 [Zopfochytrium polystomum]
MSAAPSPRRIYPPPALSSSRNSTVEDAGSPTAEISGASASARSSLTSNHRKPHQHESPKQIASPTYKNSPPILTQQQGRIEQLDNQQLHAGGTRSPQSTPIFTASNSPISSTSPSSKRTATVNQSASAFLSSRLPRKSTRITSASTTANMAESPTFSPLPSPESFSSLKSRNSPAQADAALRLAELRLAGESSSGDASNSSCGYSSGGGSSDDSPLRKLSALALAAAGAAAPSAEQISGFSPQHLTNSGVGSYSFQESYNSPTVRRKFSAALRTYSTDNSPSLPISKLPEFIQAISAGPNPIIRLEEHLNDFISVTDRVLQQNAHQTIAENELWQLLAKVVRRSGSIARPCHSNDESFHQDANNIEGESGDAVARPSPHSSPSNRRHAATAPSSRPASPHGKFLVPSTPGSRVAPGLSKAESPTGISRSDSLEQSQATPHNPGAAPPASVVCESDFSDVEMAPTVVIGSGGFTPKSLVHNRARSPPLESPIAAREREETSAQSDSTSFRRERTTPVLSAATLVTRPRRKASLSTSALSSSGPSQSPSLDSRDLSVSASPKTPLRTQRRPGATRSGQPWTQNAPSDAAPVLSYSKVDSFASGRGRSSSLLPESELQSDSDGFEVHSNFESSHEHANYPGSCVQSSDDLFYTPRTTFRKNSVRERSFADDTSSTASDSVRRRLEEDFSQSYDAAQASEESRRLQKYAADLTRRLQEKEGQLEKLNKYSDQQSQDIQKLLEDLTSEVNAKKRLHAELKAKEKEFIRRIEEVQSAELHMAKEMEEVRLNTAALKLQLERKIEQERILQEELNYKNDDMNSLRENKAALERELRKGQETHCKLQLELSSFECRLQLSEAVMNDLRGENSQLKEALDATRAAMAEVASASSPASQEQEVRSKSLRFELTDSAYGSDSCNDEVREINSFFSTESKRLSTLVAHSTAEKECQTILYPKVDSFVQAVAEGTSWGGQTEPRRQLSEFSFAVDLEPSINHCDAFTETMPPPVSNPRGTQTNEGSDIPWIENVVSVSAEVQTATTSALIAKTEDDLLAAIARSESLAHELRSWELMEEQVESLRAIVEETEKEKVALRQSLTELQSQAMANRKALVVQKMYKDEFSRWVDKLRSEIEDIRDTIVKVTFEFERRPDLDWHKDAQSPSTLAKDILDELDDFAAEGSFVSSSTRETPEEFERLRSSAQSFGESEALLMCNHSPSGSDKDEHEGNDVEIVDRAEVDLDHATDDGGGEDHSYVDDMFPEIEFEVQTTWKDGAMTRLSISKYRSSHGENVQPISTLWKDLFIY